MLTSLQYQEATADDIEEEYEEQGSVVGGQAHYEEGPAEEQAEFEEQPEFEE